VVRAASPPPKAAPPPADPTAFPAGWVALSNEIRACERCPLHRTRIQAVVYRGAPRPRLLFIGEAPGAEEDKAGVPFVGRSGAMLDAAVARLGLAPGEFGVLNVLKCRPPRNRFDTGAAACCRPYLDRQLTLLRPEAVVTLGARALAAIDPGAPPVTRAAGKARAWNGLHLFPMLHPAATFRATRYREQWDRDLRALGRELARWRTSSQRL
jgi:DNA polymerase